jgi:multidrug transporter EmrE-like cation transporter
MAWVWLTLAGLLEVVWAVGLKYTDGFTRLVPSAVTVAAMIASVYFLALAVRTIRPQARHALAGCDEADRPASRLRR